MDKLPNKTDLHSPWPHRWAVVLCCATFPLVWVGGLVTTYDAGMAVPDWPTTYGYNLFLYPWQTWILGPFDLLIEHGHRLLGSAVGMLSIVFMVSVFWCDKRPRMRWAAVVMFCMVVAQGVLGGLRVRLDQRELAMVHACLGLATFAYSAAMAAVTSRSFRQLRLPASVTRESAHRLVRLATLTAGLVYLQIVLGAMLRHVPVGATAGFFRVAVLFHIVVGLAVFGHVTALAIRAGRDFRSERRIEWPIGGLGLLMIVQLGLGAATWVLKYGWPSWIADQPFAAGFTVQANSYPEAMVATLHMATGALIFALSVVVAIRSWKLVAKSSLAASSEIADVSSGVSRLAFIASLSAVCLGLMK